eukprot:Sspe_Gene.111375::Locus_93426_Transcript_1_1_Confidence_1.000_Length_492::g.111375::m.111375
MVLKPPQTEDEEERMEKTVVVYDLPTELTDAAVLRIMKSRCGAQIAYKRISPTEIALEYRSRAAANGAVGLNGTDIPPLGIISIRPAHGVLDILPVEPVLPTGPGGLPRDPAMLSPASPPPMGFVAASTPQGMSRPP